MTNQNRPEHTADQTEDAIAVERRERKLHSHSDQKLIDWLNRELSNRGWVAAKARLMSALRFELADRGLTLPGHEDTDGYVFQYRTHFEIEDCKVVRIATAGPE